MTVFTRSISACLSRGHCARFSTATLAHRNAPLDIHPEIQEALATNKPVVALETTLVTHGFPYPTNYDLSLDLEEIVRSTGAVPRHHRYHRWTRQNWPREIRARAASGQGKKSLGGQGFA